VADAIAGREAPADDTKGFINRVAEQEKKRTKGDRVRERFDELSPLYRELLGDDADSRKQQALLLLAEAGFKFAGTAKPTMGMALADAMSGIPAGMSALAAQKAEREAKVKASALSQAVEDIGAEDTAARAEYLENLKGMQRIQLEAVKQMGQSGTIDKYAGAGLVQVETKDGSFVRHEFNPDDPVVAQARESRYTLTPGMPFVQVGGPSPRFLVTDPKERQKIMSRIVAYENALDTLRDVQSNIVGAYGGGAFLSNLRNNYLTPITPLSPNPRDAAKFNSIKAGINRMMVDLATADSEGRPSVFLQQESKRLLPDSPAKFFADAEVNIANLGALATMFKNRRQEFLTQLGIIDQQMTLSTPPTGTKNDPFVMPENPEQAANLTRFIANSVQTVTDPKYFVYIRDINGQVRAYRPEALRSSGAQ
jgi:hypothetical protein